MRRLVEGQRRNVKEGVPLTAVVPFFFVGLHDTFVG
jgi:hypothetical protein